MCPKKLLLLGLLLLSGCKPTNPTTASPAESIQLVTLMPLTGTLGSKGPGRQKAAELALQQINAAGGVGGKTLSARHLDSETNAAAALKKVQDFLTQYPQTPFIIGASSSQVSRTVLEEAKKHKVRMISPASTSSYFTSAADNDLFFRTAPSDAYQGVVLARRMQEANIKRLGVLHLNDTYGQSLKDTLSSAFQGAGGEVVATEGYLAMTPGQDALAYQNQLKAQLKNMLSTPLDGLCLIGYPAEAPHFFNAWLESGLQPNLRWFFSDGLKAAEIMNNVSSPTRFDGSLGTVPSSSPRAEASQFETDFLEAFNELPVSFAANTYDAVMLAALALQKVASGHSSSLENALKEVSAPPGTAVYPGVEGIKNALKLVAEGKEVDYHGASGEVNFDAQGDVLSDYEIWTLKKGFIFRVETRSAQPGSAAGR